MPDPIESPPPGFEAGEREDAAVAACAVEPGAGVPGSEQLRELPSRLLGLTAALADRIVGAGLAGVDARKWHYAVLAVLRESGPASQAELSRRSGIYRSDMVAILNELADREYVRRDPDPSDRRRNVVTLTESGRAHLTRLDALVAELQDELLAPLDTAERAELTRLLNRVLAHHTH
ncbi:MarR family winged helix-turn-helix transcriptional regulator [Actinomadura atramentaria]|uniref:MarR family winged helix-turn-helix transcriptional regulator n=1 Tax=Actinomadura atramentaria TaxID=1990 RepID=UPI000377A35A|nr:MarR family transcriptional regulator [Actinomadura atramentaria]